MIAADAPLRDYAAAAIEAGLADLAWVSARATAHETVVEHVMRLGTVLPMKLFTLFHDDQRALADVGKRVRAVRAALDRVEGCVEIGVRVRLDAARTLARARERAGAIDSGAGGAAFLRRKKNERDAALETGRRALAAGEAAYERLASMAVESFRRAQDPGDVGARLVLDAAFLVRKDALREFETEARAAAGAVSAEGGELELTGPWPPYHFVGDDR